MISVDRLDDPRLDPYRELKAKSLAGDHAGGLFVAEGKLVVRRLLASRFAVHSVLLAQSRVDSFSIHVPDAVETLVAPDHLVSQLVGFQFHSGVLACGVRQWDDESAIASGRSGHALLVCCPDLTLADNLGSIARLAAGFGAKGLITGPQSIDPFARRCVRVSMGQLFRLALFRPDDLAAFLQRLKTDHGFRLVAAERTTRSVSLASHVPVARTILLLGNEGRGLEPRWLDLADDVVEIDLADGVDSLNVAVAAGIVMYELTRPSRASRGA